MDVKNAFFRKFKDEEAEKQAELNVEKPKAPKIVVVTYEILDFLRLKDPATAGEYHVLVQERKALNEGAKTAEDWEKAKPRLEELNRQIYSLIAMEHQCPAPEVELYEPLMFIEANGITHYQPDETHEHSLVQDCLTYLLNRIAEDIQEGIIVPAEMKEMMFFSGLHGKGGPSRIAVSLVQQFGIADKLKVYATGGGMDKVRSGVEHISGNRKNLVNAINAYLKIPYLECRNRFEQGLEDLHVIES